MNYHSWVVSHSFQSSLRLTNIKPDITDKKNQHMTSTKWHEMIQNDMLISTAKWQTDKTDWQADRTIYQTHPFPVSHDRANDSANRLNWTPDFQANKKIENKNGKKTYSFPWPISASAKIGGKKEITSRENLNSTLKLHTYLWHHRGPIKENDASSTESGFSNPFRNIS